MSVDFVTWLLISDSFILGMGIWQWTKLPESVALAHVAYHSLKPLVAW